MEERGPELLVKETRYLRSIFTNLNYTLVDYNVKSDTEIWVLYRITGIHTSTAWGFEPTKNNVNGEGIGIFYLKDNKIIDQKRIYSLYDLFASSGAVPQFWELSSKLD